MSMLMRHIFMLEVSKHQQGLEMVPVVIRNSKKVSIDLAWSYEVHEISFTCLASVYDTCPGWVAGWVGGWVGLTVILRLISAKLD